MLLNRGFSEASTCHCHSTTSNSVCSTQSRPQRTHRRHLHTSWSGGVQQVSSHHPHSAWHHPQGSWPRGPWQSPQLCSAGADYPLQNPGSSPGPRPHTQSEDSSSSTEDLSSISSNSNGTHAHSSSSSPAPDKKEAWRIVPLVPWGTGKIVQVMVLWLLAYIIIGQVAVPVTLSLLGLEREELGLRGHAVLHLCLDLSQLAFTIFILWNCLKKYKPREKGLFPFRWQGWWPLVVLGACLVFPAVDWLAQQSLTWFPVDTDGWGSHMEASLSVGDWITNVAYFSVVSVCAPIWEEAIFRGFLLTSLARYMAPPWAVATSSLLFAMCHFRLQTFFPLLVLGVVFSLVFLLTRNLLPPMVLHSLWNVFVLANLLFKHMG